MFEEIVRCPYCVEGSEFRPMTRRSKKTFACMNCGHTAAADEPHAKCPCPKCRALRLATRSRTTEELRKQNALGQAARL